MAVWWGWRRSRRRRDPLLFRRHRGLSVGHRDGFTDSISLLITGDEEGPAINGTLRVLDWMKAKGEIPDHCLIGDLETMTEISHRVLDSQFANPPCPA